MQATFYVQPQHQHYYLSICCESPIMEGSEVDYWGDSANTILNNMVGLDAISGYCSSCRDHAIVECVECQTGKETTHDRG